MRARTASAARQSERPSELEHRHEREPPGRISRASNRRIEVREVGVAEDEPDLVAKAISGAPFGNAARATRAVSSGTGVSGEGWRDMAAETGSRFYLAIGRRSRRELANSIRRLNPVHREHLE